MILYLLFPDKIVLQPRAEGPAQIPWGQSSQKAANDKQVVFLPGWQYLLSAIHSAGRRRQGLQGRHLAEVWIPSQAWADGKTTRTEMSGCHVESEIATSTLNYDKYKKYTRQICCYTRPSSTLPKTEEGKIADCFQNSQEASFALWHILNEKKNSGNLFWRSIQYIFTFSLL